MRVVGIDPGQQGGAVLVEDGEPVAAMWWRPRARTKGLDLVLGRGEWLVTVWRPSKDYENTFKCDGFADVCDWLGALCIEPYILAMEGLYVGRGTGGAMVPLIESAGWLHATARVNALGDTHRPKPQEWRKLYYGKAPRGTDAAKRAAIEAAAARGLTGKVWSQSGPCEALGIAHFGAQVGLTCKSGDEWDDLADQWHVGE